jgi:hypothetical protein
MTRTRFRMQSAALTATLGLLLASGTVGAETLLVERVQQETRVALPARGLSMAQVQARFGAPASRLEPRGGQKPQWPVIHRWSYPAFTVYFEKDKVIDAVLNEATPTEIGPKPPIR